MGTHLKLRQVRTAPDWFVAFEYESDTYLSYARTTEFPNIRWQSDELGEVDVADVLRERGWHSTDIGDELDEARKHFQCAV